jgi:hypothetical protein
MIYAKRDKETVERSVPADARARRLCAALALGTALFASAAPAHADDGLPIGNVPGDAVATTVTEIQDAAAAQASAIADAVANDASAATQDASTPTQNAPQTGSASAVAAGISSAPAQAQTPTTTPSAPAQSGESRTQAAVPGAAVVAPASPVVSPTSEAAVPVTTARPDHAAPSAALHELANQYQKNPGRYQPLNSVPISRETASASALESLVKRSRSITRSRPPKSPGIPLPKCLRDLPQSALQRGCEDALGQLSGADLTAIANAAANGGSTSHAGKHTQHRPDGHPARTTAPTAAAESITSTGTIGVTHSEQPRAPRAVIRPETVAVRRALPSTPREPVGTPRSVLPLDVLPAPASPAKRRSPSEREAARAERSTAPIWSQLGLVLLLVGITSIALAFTSVGSGGAAVVGALVARVRGNGPWATAFAARFRSKGLSPTAGGGPRERRERRAGIRYRD